MNDAQSLFLAFYDSHYEKIHTHVYYSTGYNSARADDLTSEIFLKAWEHLDQFNEDSSMKTWIYAITRNHIIDYYRTRREHISLEEVERIPDTLSIHTELAAKEEARKVLTAIPKLSPRYQTIVTLKYIDELDTAEIATIMRMPESRVYVVLHRALKKLRALLT